MVTMCFHEVTSILAEVAHLEPAHGHKVTCMEWRFETGQGPVVISAFVSGDQPLPIQQVRP